MTITEVDLAPLWLPPRLGRPRTEPVPPMADLGEDRWIRSLIDPFEIGEGLAVPARTRPDGLTIPQIAWHVTMTPWDPQGEAAMHAHDFLYTWHRFPRVMVDTYFYKVLLACGVDVNVALVMFRAVRFAGRKHWANDARAMRYIDYLIPLLPSSFETKWFYEKGDDR